MTKQYRAIYNFDCNGKKITTICEMPKVPYELNSWEKDLHDEQEAKYKDSSTFDVKPLKCKQIVMPNRHKAKLFYVDGVVYARYADCSASIYTGEIPEK